MIKIDFKNSGIKPKNLQKEIDSLLKKKESAFLTPWEQDLSEIEKFAQEAKEKFDNVVVIGIGGSINGAKALFETLCHPYWNLTPKKLRKGWPKMFFIDNLDPNKIAFLTDVIEEKKTLVVIISKSGETTEVLSLALKNLGRIKSSNTVVITEQNSSTLNKIAKAKKLRTFKIPKEISGRFSVFTPAGLLPAALCGIDIKKLVNSTKEIEIEEIPASLAYIQYKLNKKGVVLFPYADNFHNICDWYKQLLAESLGKKETLGPVPISAIGPKDQHSLLQLLVDGPKDKFVLFLEIEDFIRDFNIGKTPHKKFLSGKNISEVIRAEKKATEKILTQKGQKNATLSLKYIDEKHIGQLLYILEAQVALLGELYKVNAFNQPGVEAGKKLTIKILEQN